MKRITKPLLAFLAIAAICMAGFQAMNTYTNFKAMPVTSNVMEPTVMRGSLLFMERIPEKDLKPGDVIAVGLPNQQNHSVGRLIQSSQMADGYYTLSFKGDNRTLPETFPYTVKDSTYLNKFAVPFVGYLFVFLSSPFGLVLLVGAALVFAWYFLFKMHDRMTWVERSKKFASYSRRAIEEKLEQRKRYVAYRDFFTEESEDALYPRQQLREHVATIEYPENHELALDSEVNEANNSDEFNHIINPQGDQTR